MRETFWQVTCCESDFCCGRIVSKVSSFLCIFWKAKRIRCSCFVSLQRHDFNLCNEENELLTARRARPHYSLWLTPVGLRAEFISRTSGYRKITVGDEYVSNKYSVAMELWWRKTNKYILYTLLLLQVEVSLCCWRAEKMLLKILLRHSDLASCVVCVCFHLHWGKKSILFWLPAFIQ